MLNGKDKEPCVLCGQPVEISGFSLTTSDGTQKFCCAGCLSIYQLLYQDDTKSTITPITTKK
ncbi:heavy metal translocating P-type ATPase metal-binding domain-containing protein [Methylobacter sp. Wu8]|uniref:heavy metal translocating P-type ATPase metal-binding domain-containing protein n=1 Tax=Methylobacter sp. Wu8 TaxID=3118457 RepID=UPI002F321B9F